MNILFPLISWLVGTSFICMFAFAFIDESVVRGKFARRLESVLATVILPLAAFLAYWPMLIPLYLSKTTEWQAGAFCGVVGSIPVLCGFLAYRYMDQIGAFLAKTRDIIKNSIAACSC